MKPNTNNGGAATTTNYMKNLELKNYNINSNVSNNNTFSN